MMFAAVVSPVEQASPVPALPPEIRPEPRASAPILSPPPVQPVSSELDVGSLAYEGTTEKKPFPVSIILGGTGVLGVVVLLSFWLFHSSPTDSNQNQTQQQKQQQINVVTPDSTKPTDIKQDQKLQPALVNVAIDSQPWAEIEISSPDSKQEFAEKTPCLISLPAGRYTVLFKSNSAEFRNMTKSIEVSENSRQFSFRFEGLNPENIAESLLK